MIAATGTARKDGRMYLTVTTSPGSQTGDITVAANVAWSSGSSRP